MILAFPFALAALAAQPADSGDRKCADPQSQAEMNTCAAIAFEQADAELDAEYARALSDARANDASPDSGRTEGDDRPGEEATLSEAQRAWVAYRDSHCRLEGYSERGGSMEALVRDECLARLTRERIAQLRPQPALGE
ncbi:MAG TPA: lysozyme inhibitor LprI family protein [Allosphingosinicella sp.]|nr:lysozyme inhibitor LprI family protein [Allosphingosinicella sp.]